MNITISDKALLKTIVDFQPDSFFASSSEILKERHDNYGNSESLKDINKKLKDNNPFDEESKGLIQKLLSNVEALNSDDAMYTNIDLIMQIWTTLIKKSIMLLRICDLREPYLYSDDKNPSPYGLSELKAYMKDYQDFEKLLYGTPYYRDHIVHVFKSWLLGINIMLEEKGYLNAIGIEGHAEFKLTEFEKISIWTLIALCHDLGYPLEKAQKIIKKTSDMMKYFVANPQITTDIRFTDTQDEMNKIIIKMASSKIKETKEGDKKYLAAVQPKYYMKFLKSFEQNSHGLISSIIMYKLLLYFMESEFSTSDSYVFNSLDAEQFLIRREILRAISSHTTKDIYHLNADTFSFLLIFCDELQEWGRRDWNAMYKGTSSDNKIEIEEFQSESIKVEESVMVKENDIHNYIDRIFEHQFNYYKTIFRDGQDTVKRRFDFIKTFKLTMDKNRVDVKFEIKKDMQASFTVDTSKIASKKDVINKIYETISAEKFFLCKTKTEDEKKVLGIVVK